MVKSSAHLLVIKIPSEDDFSVFQHKSEENSSFSKFIRLSQDLSPPNLIYIWKDFWAEKYFHSSVISKVTVVSEKQ